MGLLTILSSLLTIPKTMIDHIFSFLHFPIGSLWCQQQWDQGQWQDITSYHIITNIDYIPEPDTSAYHFVYTLKPVPCHRYVQCFQDREFITCTPIQPFPDCNTSDLTQSAIQVYLNDPPPARIPNIRPRLKSQDDTVFSLLCTHPHKPTSYHTITILYRTFRYVNMRPYTSAAEEEHPEETLQSAIDQSDGKPLYIIKDSSP
jgi:hypothetical protein